jgi:hypothetical protein
MEHPDLDALRERFKQAIGGLPNYKRTDAWSYVAALEVVIQRKDKEIEKLADSYEQGERAGMSRANQRPGDGDMGG